MKYDAIIFDFDGVLLESEYAGNKQIAEYLTSIGHPTTPEDSMANFLGLAGADFLGAIERWIGRTIPDDFHAVRAEEDSRVLEEGLPAVAGAIRFIENLPETLPRAIASSSSTPSKSKIIASNLMHALRTGQSRREHGWRRSSPRSRNRTTCPC